MSDLQIVLIIIGGLIIIAVLVFNWWQERRFHQQVENNFSAINSDALLEEPVLHTRDLLDAEDNFDDIDFSINHDLIKETPIAAIEPVIEVPDAFDEPAIYSEPSYSESSYSEPEITEFPEITEAPAFNETMSEAITAAEPLAENASAMFNSPDIKPVNHDGIKAIFQDAFNKNPTPDNSQQSYTDKVPSQGGDAKPETLAQSLPAKLHAQVDLIAVLHLAAESTVDLISSTLKNDFDGYDKPVFLHVQTPDLRWLLLSDISSKPEFADQKISKIACSLQLADRAGPVSRSILNRFQLAVESLGLDLDAQVEWQSTADPAADAVALDVFCIDVDKTMGFHLVHGENGAFTGTKLRGLAEAQGMELAADGSFKYYDESAKKQAASVTLAPSFVMFNRDHYPFSPDMLRQSVVKGITFQLDIPHVTNCTEAYNHMVQVAKQMETGLHAQLVDDNNRPLGDVQIEKIRHQLKIIQATMLTRGIVPGSDVAHRLFS
jgi:FtsZ-interacting cell division protein ZipA